MDRDELNRIRVLGGLEPVEAKPEQINEENEAEKEGDEVLAESADEVVEETAVEEGKEVDLQEKVAELEARISKLEN